MKFLQTATLLAATITTGLMAGLFAAFAYSVMPGLGRSSDRTMIEAMQNINRAILNPAFMLLFMGSLPLLALAGFLAWRGHGRSTLPWIIAALALYLIAFLVTSGVNVPLNDKLAAAGDPRHVKDLAAVRGDFESAWVTWNIVRALLHTMAFGCLTWALVLYGAQRLHENTKASPAAHHQPSLPQPPATPLLTPQPLTPPARQQAAP
ncbi:MAG TPA: anthrone oxygenase family protein [Nonomuraea sp.]|nr:anthrone oxygenase family protein [Nonomuraea sp.]